VDLFVLVCFFQPSNYGQNAVAMLDTVQEWVIHGLGNDPHPMHIHVNHFQVFSLKSLNCESIPHVCIFNCMSIVFL
jgi:hypothetical protein